MNAVRIGLAALTLLALAVGCDAGDCDAPGLQARLDDAAPGDVVEAGACEIEGDLTVPAGVTLRGQGVEDTVVVGSGALAAVTLEDGAALEALEVRAALGRGVRVEGPGAARLSEVTLTGPVDATGADVLPPMPGPDETATHGLIVSGAGSAEEPVTLTDVTARGFGRFGALFVDSHVRWERGAASENLATGLMAAGGSVTLIDVEICSTLRGLSPFAYGAVFRGGVDVRTDGLLLCDNQGPGALHDDATVDHVDLEARGNAEAGLWVQASASFALSGGALSDNALASLVLVETPSIAVSDTSVSDTRTATRLVGDVEVRAGDGVHVVVPTAADLSFDGLTVSGNPRAGLLMEVADGAIPAGTIDGVVVDASGDAYGAVAQTETATLGPDVFGPGLERRGAAVANDAAFADRLEVFGVVAPMFFPPPEM